MKILKVLLWILGVLAILVLALPLALPKIYTVERSAEIDAPPETVFYLASDFNYRSKWDPWLTQDTLAYVTVIGEGNNIGSGYEWKGEIIGSGKLTIKEMEKNKKIISDLEFFNPRPGKADVIWSFSEKEGKTVANWSIQGSLSYPVERLMGPFMDKILGPAVGQGMESFKKLCEETKYIPQPRTGEIGIKEIPGRKVLTITMDANMAQIGQVLGESYQKLMEYANSGKVSMAGAPFAVYETYNRETGDLKLTPGIPVASKLKSKGEIKYAETGPQKVVFASHFGPYNTINLTYDKIGDYLKKNNIVSVGKPWEEYVTDPGSVESEYLIETIVYFPIKNE